MIVPPIPSVFHSIKRLKINGWPVSVPRVSSSTTKLDSVMVSLQFFGIRWDGIFGTGLPFPLWASHLSQLITDPQLRTPQLQSRAPDGLSENSLRSTGFWNPERFLSESWQIPYGILRDSIWNPERFLLEFWEIPYGILKDSIRNPDPDLPFSENQERCSSITRQWWAFNVWDSVGRSFLSRPGTWHVVLSPRTPDGLFLPLHDSRRFVWKSHSEYWILESQKIPSGIIPFRFLNFLGLRFQTRIHDSRTTKKV